MDASSPAKPENGCSVKGGSVSVPAKVAELENGRLWIHQQVLGLDISVTHALGVDVGQATEELVHVHLGGETSPIDQRCIL